MTEPQRKIAVLIDGDNISPSSVEGVLNKVRKLGILQICRVYGNWKADNQGGWQKVEGAFPVELIHQSRYVAGKNATDMALVIDAMDILQSSDIDTFCLVSSDSDFTPLAFRLKKKGCQVIGVGSEQTNKVFVNACTQFIAIETPVKPPAEGPKPAPAPAAKKAVVKTVKVVEAPKVVKVPKVPTPIALLKKAYNAAPQENGWLSLAQLGNTLLQLDAKFKSNKYGHSTLSKLVRAHPDLFEVKNVNKQTYVKLKS